MEIGIIGSGNIGSTLARHLTALGHQVSIANSRGPASLAALAAETGATAVTAEQAASAKDLVIIAIPQKAIGQLPRETLRNTSAAVVDAGNYYPSRDGPIAVIDGGLTDSEWVARVLGRPVVKAFKHRRPQLGYARRLGRGPWSHRPFPCRGRSARQENGAGPDQCARL
jgi:predicted dinucleotide-binding enzyme